ncbi:MULTISPECIES: ABC transporter permease [Carnobacterium]|uniref:ABC transporter permease n=1 Tax=Carnobacterium TaxID=2747 RepID=UPI001D6E76F5|nr:ABC transporter permease [Carnobacterium maltaromaticum]MCC4313202.1 ABC transporter permease [Carnobacterium maltaromaticum]
MSSSMRKIQTLFMLKLEMILKNLTIMLGPIMAILFVFIFKTVVEVPTPGGTQPESVEFVTGYILQIGVIFNVTMTGIMAASMPLAEEKEMQTLRVLLSSSVSKVEFLIGSLAPVLVIMTAINFILIPISGVFVGNMLVYLLITTIVSVITIILGLLIGMSAKNQMSVSLLSMPFMLILMMIPLLFQLNDLAGKASSFIYTGTLNEIISRLAQNDPNPVSLKNGLVLVAWFIVASGSCLYFYKKKGLESE